MPGSQKSSAFRSKFNWRVMKSAFQYLSCFTSSDWFAGSSAFSNPPRQSNFNRSNACVNSDGYGTDTEPAVRESRFSLLRKFSPYVVNVNGYPYNMRFVGNVPLMASWMPLTPPART